MSSFFTVGSVLAVVCAWIAADWRELLFYGMYGVLSTAYNQSHALPASIPSWISLALIYTYLPESPRYCFVSKNVKQAKVEAVVVFSLRSTLFTGTTERYGGKESRRAT